MRRARTIWRLSVAGVAPSVLLLPVAPSSSVCEDVTPFDSPWPGDPGGHGVLRDRRCFAVSQHPERDALLRAALAGGHGDHDGGDFYRAAPLSCQPGLRVSTGCI